MPCYLPPPPLPPDLPWVSLEHASPNPEVREEPERRVGQSRVTRGPLRDTSSRVSLNVWSHSWGGAFHLGPGPLPWGVILGLDLHVFSLSSLYLILYLLLPQLLHLFFLPHSCPQCISVKCILPGNGAHYFVGGKKKLRTHSLSLPKVKYHLFFINMYI